MAVPPEVVTVTLWFPASPAGVTAVRLVADCTTTLVAATPPTVTFVAPVRSVPAIVIAVKPVVGPVFGVTVEIVGGVTNVNPLTSVAVPPAVVTLTLLIPAAPAGVTAVIVVELTRTIFVASTPPTFTLVVPVRPVPAIVIAVPPAVEPALGVTVEIVGGVTNVNPPGRVAVPPAVVTLTLWLPALPAGDTAVIVDELTTTIFVAATPPTFTLVVPVRPVPVIVIGVPPRVDPALGVTVEIVGGSDAYVKPPARVVVPPGVFTVTPALPEGPAGVTAVILVALNTATPVANTSPTLTLMALVNFVPVIVIAVPPAVEPPLGETVRMDGAV